MWFLKALGCAVFLSSQSTRNNWPFLPLNVVCSVAACCLWATIIRGLHRSIPFVTIWRAISSERYGSWYCYYLEAKLPSKYTSIMLDLQISDNNSHSCVVGLRGRATLLYAAAGRSDCQDHVPSLRSSAPFNSAIADAGCIGPSSVIADQWMLLP